MSQLPLSLLPASVFVAGAEVNNFAEQFVTGVVLDNRQVVGGELFVAIVGENNNGNKYAADALAKGALYVLTDDPDTALAAGAPAEKLLRVTNAVEALGQFARAWLSHLRSLPESVLQVVAVTGSVGKTTTKDMLAALLSPLGEVVAPPNSFNNEIGLALTVLRATAQTRTLVLEMGADNLGNIAYLTHIAPPDVSLVLCIAPAHIGNFGSIENIVEAKGELAQFTLPTGTVFLNGNDLRIAHMASRTKAKVRYFGIVNNADKAIGLGIAPCLSDEENTYHAWASEVQDVAGHAHFTLHLAEQTHALRLGLTGTHLALNAVGAAAIAQHLGVELAQIVQVLENITPASAHRMDVQNLAGYLVLDDAYNANSVSMKAGITAFGSLAAQYERRIAVLGSMLELGTESAKEHLSLLDEIQAARINQLYLVGEEISVLAPVAQNAGIAVEVFACAAQVPELSAILQPGDAIMFKGSNGSRVWELADKLKSKLSESKEN